MADTFVHLSLHSDFSMVDGLNKVNPILDAVSVANMPAVALTDKMNLCGLIRFYSGAQGRGIKPIVGCDINVLSDHIDGFIGKMNFLAMDNQGYKNITSLISDAYTQGHIQQKHVAEAKWLDKYSESVILLSGGMDSDLGELLSKGKMSSAKQVAEHYAAIFPNRFYIELSRVGRESEQTYIYNAVSLAAELGLPVVATNNVRFLKKDDFYAHEIRTCIAEGYTLEDTRRPKKYTDQQYLK